MPFRRIGFINKLIGFQGECMLALEHFRFEDLEKQKFLFIELDGIRVPFEIIQISEKAGNPVLKFLLVPSKEYALRFINCSVYVEEKKRKLNQPSFEEFELTGYKVIDIHAGLLGTITSVEHLPQHPVAACTKNGSEILIPLHENFIIEIDAKKKQLTVNLPSGFIDLYIE